MPTRNSIPEGGSAPILVRSIAFEGGSGSGDSNFPPDVVGQAYEELIEELDPSWTPAPTIKSLEYEVGVPFASF
jgi:hypothetical protein